MMHVYNYDTRPIRLLNTETLNLLVILQKRLRSHNDEDSIKKRLNTAQAELELKN